MTLQLVLPTSSTPTGAAENTHAVAKPAGLAAGHLVVVAVRSTTIAADWEAPDASWTELFNGLGLGVFLHTAVAGEPAAWVFTSGAGNTAQASSTATAYADAFYRTHTTRTGDTVTDGGVIVLPSVNAVDLNDLLVGVGAMAAATEVSGWGAVAPLELVTSSAAGMYHGQAIDPIDAIGATGTRQMSGPAQAHSTMGVTILLGQANVAPNAPQLLEPANGSTVDTSRTDWRHQFSDPNTGDTQSARAFRRKLTGAGSYSYWNAGTQAWQSTEVFNASTSGAWAFPAGWAAGTYQWSVATKDAMGLAGPYAADWTVTVTTPAVVTLTAPAATVTDDSRPPAVWTVADPEGDAQQSFRGVWESGAYGIVPGAGAAVYDTGVVNDPGGAVRQWPPGVDLANGTYRVFWQVTTAGATSPWVFRTFTMALTPPEAPTIEWLPPLPLPAGDPDLLLPQVQIWPGHLEADFPDSVVRLEYQDRLPNGTWPATWEVLRERVPTTGDESYLTAVQRDFEDGTVTGWANDANAAVTSQTTMPYRGARSMRMRATSAGTIRATTTPVLDTPGEGFNHRGTAWVRAAATGRLSRLILEFHSNLAGTALLTTTSGPIQADVTTGWRFLTVEAEAPAGTLSARLKYQVQGAALNEDHYGDDFRLVAPGYAGLAAPFDVEMQAGVERRYRAVTIASV